MQANPSSAPANPSPAPANPSSAQTAQPQTEAPDTLSAVFYFRQGKGKLDLRYLDNYAQFQALKRGILEKDFIPAKEIICISSASPEGSYSGNTSLALLRSASICDMLENEFFFIIGRDTKRYTELTAENWEDVKLRLDTSDIEGREDAIRLIQAVGSKVDETSSTALKAALKRLHDGRTWELMSQEIFPYTRCVYTKIIFDREALQQAGSGAEGGYTGSSPLDTAALAAALRGMLLSEGWVPGEGGSEGGQSTGKQTRKNRKDGERKPFMALKTNLLFDLASAVNAEVEFPIQNRYSILLEHTFPWWLVNIDSQDYGLQALRSGVELRRYFGDRTQKPLLAGVFMGVYANAAYFDVEWQNRGWQGETFTDCGLTFGVSKKIGTNWRMEFSVGAGYFSTPYTQYSHRQDNGLLIYQKDDRFTWLGPTKLKCSLCWLLPNYPKSKKQ